MPGKTSGQANEDFFERLKYLFTSPAQFFDKVKGEGIQNALLAYAVTLLIAVVLASAKQFLLPLGYGGRSFQGASYLSPLFGSYSGHGYESFIFLIPIKITFSLVITLAYAGLIYPMVRAFKGEGSYTGTFKAFLYGLVPYNLISIIPIVGGLSIIYSIVLTIIGVKKLHNLSTGKATTAVLLPGFVILPLLIIFLVSAYIFFLRASIWN